MLQDPVDPRSIIALPLTGADLLGRLLGGIAGKETIPPPKGQGYRM